MENKKLEHGEVEIEMTGYMAKKFKEAFDCEIEMLQGEKEKMKDGRTRYIFKVDDEKGERIKNFILGAMFQNIKLNEN